MFNPPHTQLDGVRNIDKIAHLCMYGGLEFVIWIEYMRKQKSKPKNPDIILMLVIPILLGVGLELAQSSFTNYRSCEWADIFADTAGAACGAVTGWLFKKYISGKK